jgi:hypothetical protein
MRLKSYSLDLEAKVVALNASVSNLQTQMTTAPVTLSTATNADLESAVQPSTPLRRTMSVVPGTPLAAVVLASPRVREPQQVGWLI